MNKKNKYILVFFLIFLALVVGYTAGSKITENYYFNIYQGNLPYYDEWNVSEIDSENYYENLGYLNSTFHVGFVDGTQHNIWWENTGLNKSFQFWYDVEKMKGELKIDEVVYNLK